MWLCGVYLQCFDSVDSVTGRASGLSKNPASEIPKDDPLETRPNLE